MAQQHPQFLAAGARLAGVSVDAVGQNAAMVDKLGLPFPLLSDPDGEQAIKPYDVWHADASIARPAVILVGADGQVAYRRVSADFADRPDEQDVLARVRAWRLPAATQQPPQPGQAHPGKRAVDLSWLPAYYRGAKFAVTAVRGRVPEADQATAQLGDEYDRYLSAVTWRREEAKRRPPHDG